MGIINFMREAIHSMVATTRNATSLGDTSKEGRLTLSIVISLVFFFVFLAITGDITSDACLTAGLEIVLLYALAIM